jgi:hypothetical protein
MLVFLEKDEVQKTGFARIKDLLQQPHPAAGIITMIQELLQEAEKEETTLQLAHPCSTYCGRSRKRSQVYNYLLEIASILLCNYISGEASSFQTSRHP